MKAGLAAPGQQVALDQIPGGVVLARDAHPGWRCAVIGTTQFWHVNLLLRSMATVVLAGARAGIKIWPVAAPARPLT
jgi:hypothetical protein